jgi:hypothetical protein
MGNEWNYKKLLTGFKRLKISNFSKIYKSGKKMFSTILKRDQAWGKTKRPLDFHLRAL